MTDKTDRRVGRVPASKKTERNREIHKLAMDGVPYRDLAAQFRISPARVGQIVASYGKPPNKSVVEKREDLLCFVIEHKEAFAGESPTIEAMIEGSPYKTRESVIRALGCLHDQGKIKLNMHNGQPKIWIPGSYWGIK